jgi:hypothetical protein
LSPALANEFLFSVGLHVATVVDLLFVFFLSFFLFPFISSIYPSGLFFLYCGNLPHYFLSLTKTKQQNNKTTEIKSTWDIRVWLWSVLPALVEVVVAAAAAEAVMAALETSK